MLCRRATVLALPTLALPTWAMPMLLAGTGVRAQPAQHRLRAEWAGFRDRFMAPDGRIVDSGNQNVSHTEGQGWAMLAAVRADDRPSFDRLRGWTMRALKRPGDELFSWRFQPRAARPVGDPNNATDGDLFIAWALLEAGERWGRRDCAQQGRAMARDILRLLVGTAGPYTILLPGAQGFRREEHVVVNPSYYAFPAIRALAAAVPDPAWLSVAADGVALLREGRFGRWGLPPDWLLVRRSDGRLGLPADWPPRFSYDAVRVPLYMAWVGLGAEPGLTGPAEFWNDPRHRHLPAWADLTTDGISPYAASHGIADVARLATAHRSGGELGMAPRPASSIATDYYSAALSLLSSLAARDSGMV
ncbi:glycosyl hydrolase family 5 [Roseococcus sp. SYP-B2431]|uniref:glycosyl hydrolase family 8 n=1 Tax=Roseococcus sp. SYP-B2431 TaxID=2496640 RepID=UPI00103CB18B|nr:glycosyl hydrolase family 8 [Roseococcus sp. SYP-B2431]TCH96235.1 glycosyl hydrolase family 5 [Roseococcus sp. SYP-B2431]